MCEQWYVYAVVPAGAPLPNGVPGFGGPLRVLASGDLGAVVSHVSQVSHVRTADAAGGAPAPTTEALFQHEQVVEALRSGGPALPVRFGTVLPTAEAVVRALDQRRDTLHDDLRRIGDKLEMGISALWVREAGAMEEEAGQPNVPAQPHSRPDSTSVRPGLAYLRGRQAQYRRAEAIRGQAQGLAHDLDDALRPYVLDCRHTICPSEGLALRAQYLLEEGRIRAFTDAFDRVRQHRSEVRLLLSGPWPPYSFVTPPARAGEPARDGAAIQVNG